MDSPVTGAKPNFVPVGHLPLDDAPADCPDDDLARFTIECCDALTFTKAIRDESIQLVVTSPPYNLGKSYESRTSIDEYLA